MGKTAFSGPVYGAKSLLWTVHKDNTLNTSTVATTLGAVRVPAYEDWYVTELQVWRGSSGSTAVTYTYRLTDDSTTIADVVGTAGSSASAVLLSTTPTPTAGEYEGVQVAANSTLAFTYDHGGSSVASSSDLTATVYGYIRYIDSTRSV